MKLKNLLFPSTKTDAAANIESAVAELVRSLPEWCNTLAKARRVREWASAMDDRVGEDRAGWTQAQRVGRALDKIIPKLSIAERRGSVADALADQQSAARRESERAGRSHQDAMTDTEKARSKLAGAEQQIADLERERSSMVATSGAAVAAAGQRLDEAVASGDLVAEQTAAAALSEAQERSRAQRTVLAAIEARLAARAKLAEELESVVRNAEDAEAEARQQLHLAAVRMAAIRCDQVSESYIEGLVGVTIAMREAQAAGIQVGALPGYAALADVRLWVGDVSRSLVGIESSNVKAGAFPAHHVLAQLAPVDPSDLADLQGFDAAALTMTATAPPA